MCTLKTQSPENHHTIGYYFYGMTMHIGKQINELREKRGLSTSALAKKINRSREALYDIYNRNTVDTELLKAISEALQYNFFVDLANQPMLIDNFTPGSVGVGAANIVSESQAEYGNNYREKYFTLLEKYVHLQEANSGSVADTLKGIATRNEAFQELLMEFLADQRHTSIEAVHASLGTKIFAILEREKAEGTRID
jgi:transcriptional regulator with XRE-family HTH domain